MPGAAGVLLVGVIVLDGVPTLADGAGAGVRLLRVARVPDLNLLHVGSAEPSGDQTILEVASVVVAAVWIAHEKVLLPSEQNLKL